MGSFVFVSSMSATSVAQYNKTAKSIKQAVIIQSTKNSLTKSNSLNEHMHLDNHPSRIIACETHLLCYHGQLCFSSISLTSVAHSNQTVIIQSTKKNRTKSNSPNEHMH
jgi:hypothetical protein